MQFAVLGRARSDFAPFFLAVSIAFVLSGCTKVKLSNQSKVALLQQAPFAVTSIQPSSGYVDGGTTVTITGTGFLPGSTVTIGGVACLNVTVVSETQMTCITGAHAQAVVDVTVSLPYGGDGVLATSYTYTAPPSQRAGFAVTAGGGVSTGGAIMVQATIGEAQGIVLTSPSVNLLSGVAGANYR